MSSASVYINSIHKLYIYIYIYSSFYKCKTCGHKSNESNIYIYNEVSDKAIVFRHFPIGQVASVLSQRAFVKQPRFSVAVSPPRG